MNKYEESQIDTNHQSHDCGQHCALNASTRLSKLLYDAVINQMKSLVTSLLLAICIATSWPVHADKAAATKAAKESSACKNIQPFYWEIGDANQILASGSEGNSPSRDTPLQIASASKLIFAAYVFEKKHDQLTDHEKSLLKMLGGYQNLNFAPCIFRNSVSACFHNRGNDKVYDDTLGKYYYSGGWSKNKH